MTGRRASSRKVAPPAEKQQEEEEKKVVGETSGAVKPTTRPLFSKFEPAPLSYEPAAVAERDSIDYTVRVTAEMAHSGMAPRRVRVYADGIYDLFHQGHARQLMQAKCVFPNSEVYLMVGCCNDQLTHSKKGKTVMDENERYEALRHCRYVDEVVVDAPWVLDDDFIEKHKIDFVAHDDEPYTTGSANDVYASVKARGMFVATQRTEGVSTSDVVARIVRDYDTYVRRNLKRGYSRQELNVSFVKGQKYKLQNKVDEIKTGVHDRLTKWEEQSKELITSFIHRFGGHSIEQMFVSGSQRFVRAISPSQSREGSPVEEEDRVAEEEPAPKKRKLESA